MIPTPRKPSHLDPRAERLLEWLGAQPWAGCVVLGGGVALKHYLDYRPTKDCEAWWGDATPAALKETVLAEIANALEQQNPGCKLRRDNWGKVLLESLTDNVASKSRAGGSGPGSRLLRHPALARATPLAVGGILAALATPVPRAQRGGCPSQSPPEAGSSYAQPPTGKGATPDRAYRTGRRARLAPQ